MKSWKGSNRQIGPLVPINRQRISFVFIRIVNKSFYLHYPDVRALLDEIVNELMAQFEDMLESFRPGEMLLRSGAQAGYRVTDAATPMRGIFHFVAQNADICRVLLCGPQETAFVDKVNQLVRERVLDEWAALVGKESRLGYDYVFSFFVAGCIGLLRQWLQQGMPLAPDEMATVVEGIITKGVLALQ